jgi:cysteinyl-tRNA synthetase
MSTDPSPKPTASAAALRSSTLRVYNTLTRQKEIFQTVQPGKVGMYLCGPTVYKPPHVGHMVGPVIFDAIKRYLVYKGFQVTWIVNITDVEDKLIDQAAEQNTSVAAIAEQCTLAYFQCLEKLGIDTIDQFPKASDHMAEIIALCQKLIANGHAYAAPLSSSNVADANVYFDVAKDPDYGKLSHRKPEEQETGNRAIESTGKRNPADFALWKAAKPGEPFWPSPWGNGRPGWHIECSAMSMKYLGPTFDIHGGGLDLLFPHHENELAQSECANDQPLARYWLHNGLTRMRTKMPSGEWRMEKQSKSLGNVIDASKLIDDLGPDLVRYLLLSTHYRSPIDFSDDVVAASKKAFTVFARVFERMERLTGQPLAAESPDIDKVAPALLEDKTCASFARQALSFKAKFMEMMDDDFNTAGAISALHELAGQINAFIDHQSLERDKSPIPLSAAVAAVQTLRNLGRILGLFRISSAARPQQPDLSDQLMSLLIQLRNDARKTKNFALADAVRNGLLALGITLEDRPDGTGWRKG